jgi:hypothetical protein
MVDRTTSWLPTRSSSITSTARPHPANASGDHAANRIHAGFVMAAAVDVDHFFQQGIHLTLMGCQNRSQKIVHGCFAAPGYDMAGDDVPN